MKEQYSGWPAYREIPLGWRAVGKEGIKRECLQYIDEVWTDMRPLSLRKRMAENGQRNAGARLRYDDAQNVAGGGAADASCAGQSTGAATLVTLVVNYRAASGCRLSAAPGPTHIAGEPTAGHWRFYQRLVV
jgi:MbtH protein